MPQIAQLAATYSSQIFWMVLVFALIYFGIGKAMLPGISATIDQREQRIAADLGAAQAARVAADSTEAAYRTRMDAVRAEAAQATAEAKASAARATEARLRAADAELDVKVDAATARLKEQQDAALAEIEAVAAEAAQDIVARVSGVTVDQATAAGAVRAALARG